MVQKMATMIKELESISSEERLEGFQFRRKDGSGELWQVYRIMHEVKEVDFL